MQDAAGYDDVVGRGRAPSSRERAAALRGARAWRRERIVLDPGIGFGKTPEHNLELLRASASCCALGRAAAGRLVAQVDAGRGHRAGRCGERLAASVAAALAAVQRGARIVRVHDVAATVDALKVWQAGCARSPAADAGSARRPCRHPMSRTLLRHRRHPRHGRHGADHARLHAAPGPCGRAACCGAPSARPTVLIGKDTRISGYMIESALEAGFASAGVDVLLTGPLPTPGVAYLTRALRLDLGVVISASHNPFADNGIKFFSARGEKLPDDWERAVEAALERAAAVGRLGRRSARRAGSTTRAAATSSSARAPCGSELSLQGPEDRRRCRARRGLPRRARRVPRARRRGRRPSAASPTASTSTPASAPPRRRRWSHAVRERRRRLRRRARRRRRPAADGRRRRAACTTATNCST